MFVLILVVYFRNNVACDKDSSRSAGGERNGEKAASVFINLIAEDDWRGFDYFDRTNENRDD